MLGDWTANLLYLRPQQLVLGLNERSLLCVVVPASRAVLGCMNDPVVQLGAYPVGRHGGPSLSDAALHLAGNIYWSRANEPGPASRGLFAGKVAVQ